jgi:hypothetical protein
MTNNNTDNMYRIILNIKYLPILTNRIIKL